MMCARRHARDVSSSAIQPSTLPRQCVYAARSERARVAADALARAGAAAEHAHGVEARGCELEDRRRDGIEIVVEVPHLRAEVAARVREAAAARVRAVEPAQAREPERPGKSADEKGRVGESRDRRKRGRHRMQRALGAKPRERGKRRRRAGARGRVEVSKRAPSATSRMSGMLTSAAAITLATTASDGYDYARHARITEEASDMTVRNR